MLEALPDGGHKTVGADKNYDTAAFVAQQPRRRRHPAPWPRTSLRIADRTSTGGRRLRHAGYRLSQIIRKRIEEANGWIKEVGGMAQTKLRGVKRVEWMFVFKGSSLQLDPLAAAAGDRVEFCPKSVQGRISGLANPRKRLKITLRSENRR